MILQIGSSFGRGIALQAKPDIRPALDIIQRREERRAAEKTAEKAARDKKRKELDSYITSIEVDYSKYDIVYHEDIKLALADYIKTTKEEQAKNIYGSFRNTENSLRAKRNLDEITGTARLGTKDLDAAKSFIGDPKNRGLFELNTELNELYLEAQRTEDPTDFWEAFETAGGKRGAVVPRGSLYTLKEPEINLTRDIRKELLPLFREAKDRGQIAYTEPDGTVVTKKTEELTPKDLESILDFNLLNLDIANQVEKNFARLPIEEKEKYRNARDWYIDTFAPFLDKEVWEKRTKPIAKREKVTEANIQTDKLYSVKGGTITAPRSISLGTGTKRFNFTGKMTVFHTETGEEIDIKKSGVTLQDFARLPFVSAKIFEPLIGKENLAKFTYYKAIDSYYVTNEEVLGEIPEKNIIYKNAAIGLTKPVEEEWEIGTVGTIPVIILFDNQESMFRKNFPPEYKLFLEKSKKEEPTGRTEEEKTNLRNKYNY